MRVTNAPASRERRRRRLELAVRGRETHCAVDGLGRGAEQLGAGAVEALRQL